jgi:superfamily II DNA/RNA helicase
MKNPIEVIVDEKKLTPPGLKQYFVFLADNEKIKKLLDLLDLLMFN